MPFWREQRERSATTQTWVAVASLLAAWLARWLLDPWVGNRLPFATFFTAVAVTAWYARYPQSIAVALVGYLLGSWFFDASRGSFGLNGDYATPLAYSLNAAIIIILSEQMHKAERASRRMARDLQTVLSSIGEAVIATDNRAIVVYLNQKAEELIGWRSAEVTGKPLTQVLRINNDHRETTRESTERVLDENDLMASAKQVALVSRDGTVIPIRKSASPLVDASGTVRGLVLVIHGVADETIRSQEHQLS